MVIFYRVEFTAETTPDDAHEVVYGLNGGNVGDERVAIVGTNTTAWFSLAVPDRTTRKASPIEAAVKAALDADTRVTTYSVTGLVGADEFRIG